MGLSVNIKDDATRRAVQNLELRMNEVQSPVFAGLTLTGFSGILKATAGVLSAAALTDADIPDTITLTNITQITNRSHTNLTDVGTLTHATLDSYLDQSVKVAASPSFAGLTLAAPSGNTNLLVDSAASATVVVDRATTTNGAGYNFKTAGGDCWNLGMDASSTAFSLNRYTGSPYWTEVFSVSYTTGAITLTLSPFITTIKSGATQAAAGAAANELWKTSGHATLPDNVVMIGVT